MHHSDLQKNKSLMSRTLGIDIGSTTSSVVVINDNGIIEFLDYTFHKGQIIETLYEQINKINLNNIQKVAYTSSTPSVIKTGREIDSRVSHIIAAKHFYKNPEALLIIGAEKFGMVRFGNDGEYLNYRSNTSCAAGTGSFLDQQVGRLNLENISHLGELAANNTGNFPKIASRCSVFAKTDLIHAQQEGFSLAGICDGLCYGLAKNVVDAVFDEKDCSEIIVAGGVSLNAGVLKHIRELSGAQIIVDDYSQFYGAIGAALSVNKDYPDETVRLSVFSDLVAKDEKKKDYYYPPLELKLSEYPEFDSLEDYNFKSVRFPDFSPVEVSIYEQLDQNLSTDCYLGIDIGSTSTKAVILDIKKRVIAGLYTRTSAQPVTAMQVLFEAIDSIQSSKKHFFNIKAAGTTGSGRKFIGKIINADINPDEITAHARAAVELNPETDTIIEIGGQDSKFTIMRNGIVTLSIMNNVCAAGTGSFIEEQAKKLDCPLSEYSARATESASPMTSDRCTVFMERDLNYYMHEGYEKNELLASVLHSIRENYLSKVAVKANIGEKIFFQGATAKNKALVAAFEHKLQKPIMVSKFCHLTGAMGIALELHDINPESTGFRGIQLWKQDIPTRSEVCELCTNHCKLKIAEINGTTEAYGFLCGRDYNSDQYVEKGNKGFNLIKSYKQVFSFSPKTKISDITIGIPSALHMVEDKILWRRFFDNLGIKTITNDAYPTAIKDGKKIANAEFCAPVAAAHGQVHYLDDKSDFIFLPVYLKTGKQLLSAKNYCYYTQYIASMLSSTMKFRESNKILSPLIHSLKSENHAIKSLTQSIVQAGIKNLTTTSVRTAYHEAKKYQDERRQEWKNVFQKNLDIEKLNIIILGRPYTVLSDKMNNHIPEIISNNGYNPFYMDMLPESDELDEEIRILTKRIIWKYATELLTKTKYIANSTNLYPILVTSFKCTPDSFAIEYFKDIMDKANKPYLILQLDEHDSAVGYETRIEAAIRSFQNHFNRNNTANKKLQEHITVSESAQENGAPTMLDEFKDVLTDHEINHEKFLNDIPASTNNFDLSTVEIGESRKLNGKMILIPGWDMLAAKFIEAIFKAEGKPAAVLFDTPETIQRSLNLNTGQCLPLNIIAQNASEYIQKNQLDPSTVAIWVPRGYVACNLSMFPHYLKKLMRKYDEKMSEITVYPGNLGFYDFSVKMGVNVYIAYLLAGSIRKTACTIRPYEVKKGETDSIVEYSINVIYDAFLHKKPKEPILKEINKLFKSIAIKKIKRPRVAILGDLYVRENDVFNQNLVKTIEDNGGEALPTSYSEYLKIILKQTEIRLLNEGMYKDHFSIKFLKNLIPILEKKYNKYFEEFIDNIEPLNNDIEKILERHHLDIMHGGETVENILKVENLVNHYNDISLVVHTNPSYCCPSLVTEAKANHIENIINIPVISIEYDGTGGSKNDDIIPYLKLKSNHNKE